MADRPGMDAPRTGHETSAAPARWLRRTLVIAAGVCAFALVGSLFNPEWSQAGDEDRGPLPRVHGGGSGAAGPGAAGRLPVADTSSLLGMLECREYRILIHHGEEGARYTVCAPDGRVIREHLAADEVYREFPTLDLRRLRVDPPAGNGDTGALMLVYPLD